MKNEVLFKTTNLVITLTTAFLLASCNTAKFYANKRIDHSHDPITEQPESAQNVIENATKNPVDDSLKNQDVLHIQSTQPAQSSMPEKAVIKIKKRILPVSTPRKACKAIRQNNNTQQPLVKKLVRRLQPKSAAKNFDALDWNWGVIAIVVAGLSIVVAIVTTSSSFTILGFLAALAGTFLGLLGIVGCIFLLFAFLYIISFAWLWN